MISAIIIIPIICILISILLILIGLKFKKRKILVSGKILLLIILVLIVFGGIHLYNKHTEESLNKNTGEVEREKVFEEPDRIIYKTGDKYYQFQKSEEKYEEILKEIQDRIYSSYDGKVLSEEELEKVEEKDYIEFDYNQISKNNIFPLEEDEIGMIKRLETGGQVANTNLTEKEELKKKLSELIKNETEYTMSQEDYLSKNQVENVVENYSSELTYKTDNVYTKILQTKEEIDEFIRTFNVEIDKQINDELLEKNSVVALITPYEIENINCKIGSITYVLTGERDISISQEEMKYNVNILIVSKIVNEKCIYIDTDNIVITNSGTEQGINETQVRVEEKNIIQNITESVIEIGYDSSHLNASIEISENTKITDYITGNTLNLTDLKQGDCINVLGNEIESSNDMKRIKAEEIQIYKKEYAESKIQNKFNGVTVIDEGGGIAYKNIDNSGNGYIVYETSIDEGNKFIYYLKLPVTSSTETYLGWGTHLQSNYGYIEHEMARITLDTAITDALNINCKVNMIEYIAD